MSDQDLRRFLVSHIRAARHMTPFDADQLAESIVPIRSARHTPMEDVLEWLYNSTEQTTAFEFSDWAAGQGRMVAA